MQSNPTSLTFSRRPIQAIVLSCLALCLLSSAATAQTAASGGGAPHSTVVSAQRDPLVDAAFEHFYNMDYERSIPEFEKALDRRPNDPASVNHLLTAVLLRELYRMGAMNTGEYSNDSFIGQA